MDVSTNVVTVESSSGKLRAVQAKESLSSSSNADNDGLLDHYNYCGRNHLGDAGNEIARIDIWYQCRGPNYDEFGRQLEKFVQRQSLKHPATWGRRTVPIPDNQSVLFLGNSHTRQIALALACQMPEVVDVFHFEFDQIDPNMAVRIRFGNGATMYIVANSYVAYSPEWQSLLERQIQKPLAEFDMVIQGVFNVAKGKSNFLNNLLNMTSQLPYEFDLTKYPVGPTPIDIASVYKGPYMLVSNQSINQVSTYKLLREMVTQLRRNATRAGHDRDALLYMNGRHYINKMNVEGAALARVEVADLSLDSGRGNRMHHCMGPEGGHVDLLAWDVAEFMYERAEAAQESGNLGGGGGSSIASS